MTMCPALIFAASRNESVIGRTTILDDSISTRNGFNQLGAPSGRKCAMVALGIFLILERISISHIGNPILNVNKRWLVILKVYGNRPIILRIIIVKKILGIMIRSGLILNM